MLTATSNNFLHTVFALKMLSQWLQCWLWLSSDSSIPQIYYWLLLATSCLFNNRIIILSLYKHFFHSTWQEFTRACVFKWMGMNEFCICVWCIILVVNKGANIMFIGCWWVYVSTHTVCCRLRSLEHRHYHRRDWKSINTGTPTQTHTHRHTPSSLLDILWIWPLIC